ncbi:tetratricopeptide repeat protein [bacterium]|nr:tetratricopeptide repeat protein [bacterium]
MENHEIDKLKELGGFFRKMNGKMKLVSLLKKAKEEYDKNNFAESLSNCKKALEQDPQNSVALRGLGCIMQATGNNKQALKFFARALEYSQNKEIEYTLIGTLYYKEKKFEEAIKYYNLAIDINDSYDEANSGLGQALLENHLEILDMQDRLISREIF